jgi:hypothetical protein
MLACAEMDVAQNHSRTTIGLAWRSFDSAGHMSECCRRVADCGGIPHCADYLFLI